ncbi:MAG: hypothetical protein K2H34_09905, partial [Lachnospiraceae bacterium]|nr:hypothetical protein [Lachnospiraceae bacterium]
MNKKMGTRGFTTVILLLVIIGLAFYTYLNNHAGNKQEVKKSSEVDKLVNYDFENDYPKTVRETVKLHCNYMKNAYNNKFTEDELFTVNRNIRCLFDEELLAINTEEQQLQGLKDELLLYEENKQKLVSFSLAEGSQVQYNTENEKEYAKIKVTLTLSADSVTVSVQEEY